MARAKTPTEFLKRVENVMEDAESALSWSEFLEFCEEARSHVDMVLETADADDEADADEDEDGDDTTDEDAE